jgi:hypothetical protein
MFAAKYRRQGFALLICLIAVAGVSANAFGQEYWVDAAAGSDVNPGTELSPFSTITYAVATAGSGTTIHVLPGSYDDAHGESFPIFLKENQIIIGDPSAKGAGATPTTIIGKGPNPALTGVGSIATVVCAAGTEISGIQFSAVYEVLHASVVVHGSTATVRNNNFLSTVYAGILMNDAGSSNIEANLIETRQYGVWVQYSPNMPSISGNEFRSTYLSVRGVETNAIIIDNLFSGSNLFGIIVERGVPRIEANIFEPGVGGSSGAVTVQRETALPVLRSNVFQGALGVEIVDGNPDMGRSGDPGGNDFQAVTGVSVEHQGSADVSAIGNLWPNTPPIIGVDIVITGSGSVMLGPVGAEERTFGSLKEAFKDR